MHQHSPPTVVRAVSAISLSLLIASAVAFQTVAPLRSALGTIAAIPLVLVVFIVLTAVSLVLTAHLDQRLHR